LCRDQGPSCCLMWCHSHDKALGFAAATRAPQNALLELSSPLWLGGQLCQQWRNDGHTVGLTSVPQAARAMHPREEPRLDLRTVAGSTDATGHQTAWRDVALSGRDGRRIRPRLAGADVPVVPGARADRLASLHHDVRPEDHATTERAEIIDAPFTSDPKVLVPLPHLALPHL